MIKGRCRTNLDDWQRYQWPTEFVAVPRIGERVEALGGHNLRVVSVTYGMTDTLRITDYGTKILEPIVVIELNR